MDDAFSRRGFGRTLALGAAGLVLPALGRAQPPTLRPRLVLQPGRALRAELHLTATGERGLELITGSTRLVGALELRGERYAVTFDPDAPVMYTRSRAGTRLRRRVLLPVDREVLYDTFTTAWPRGLGADAAAGARLRVSVVPRPGDEAAAPLRGLVARARIA